VLVSLLPIQARERESAPVKYNTYTCNLLIMKDKKPREALE
jgi:hypothetical protein